MNRTATSDNTAVSLTYLLDSWPHLTDMLTTRHGAIWPPAGRIADQIRAEEHTDATWAEQMEARALARLAERVDSRYTLGESPAPIRLQVLDVMRAVEHDLVYLADTLAQEVQRPVMAKAPSNWLPSDRERRDKLVAEDAADKRRWRYREYRTAPFAAVWLLTRVEERPGPFLRLTTAQAHRIATVVSGAAARVGEALDAVRKAHLVWPCPLCDNPIGLSGGDGEVPVATCFGCRQVWTLELPVVA